jgi:hypothetical protein
MEIAMRMFLKGGNLPADYVGYTALGDDGGRIAAIASRAQRYALLLRADVPRLRDLGSSRVRISSWISGASSRCRRLA